MKQYGLEHPGGYIATYPSLDAAQAAQERMRRWPTTKFVKLIERDVLTGPWRRLT
jgi:hypothetical protein